MTESTDIEKVECPLCGTENCLIDPQIDQALRPGYLFTCVGCDKEIKVTAVDYDITITCEVAP